MRAVPAREVWLHEAHDFTPWLLSNADVLGEVLGMDLVLSAAEHRVGGYALDLIGLDQATSEVVIVENQLESSDHSHLGQILTYAGGTDPVNIVWVATSFREEHRAALEWLNERTDQRTRFFAVEVGVVRIGESEPAPLLRLAVRPNDWGKQVRASTASETAASPLMGSYQQFWTQFLDRLHAEHPQWTNMRKPSPQNWINMPAGLSGVLYGLSFGRRGLCSELYLGDPDADVNSRRFANAQQHQQVLETSYGAELSWEPLPGRKAARIADYLPGNVEQLDAWPEYIAWFLDSQTRLRRAFHDAGGIPALLSTP